MTDDVLQRIRTLLAGAGVAYREVEHEVTRTSEESALARGEPLGVGAKALLLATDDLFRLFVLPADRKLDSGAVKKKLSVKRLRFATAEELLERTGLLPGSVPPFGQPILPFALYADASIGVRYDRVAFNAGLLTVSMILSAADWDAVARPERFEFATG